MRCDLRQYSECDCPVDQCSQQTYTARAKQLTAKQNAEWRAYHRSLFSASTFTVLCVVVSSLLMFAAFQADRQERGSNLINQENVRHG